MPLFKKNETKSYQKQISEKKEFKTSANITVGGSLKHYLIDLLPNIGGQDNFSFLTTGIIHFNYPINLTCTIDYEQKRSGFFKPQKEESHNESSQVKSTFSGYSSTSFKTYKKQTIENPNINLLIMMPSTIEEYNQFMEGYKSNPQHTHLFVLQPRDPNKNKQLYQLSMSCNVHYFAFHVGKEELNKEAANALKKQIEETIDKVNKKQIRELEQEIQAGFKQECEADLLLTARSESEEFFAQHRCC